MQQRFITIGLINKEYLKQLKTNINIDNFENTVNRYLSMKFNKKA